MMTTRSLGRYPGWWRSRDLRVCAGLFALVFAAFVPALRNGFVDFDDPDYVTQNLHVRYGLSWRGVTWAFHSFAAANWHPLTWISHMADCQLFGLNPAGHHLISILFHAANAALLFLFWHRATRALWPSIFIAGLFGLHALRVESVAWVAERKDVLSTFFGLLAMLAYLRYARSDAARIGTRGGTPRSAPRFYLLALFFFALSLMAKPMLVTLPFLLLLLDFWPLGRTAGFGIGETRAMDGAAPPKTGERGLGRLLLEKWPFLVLTAASCLVTFLAQRRGGAVQSLERVPIGLRLENAILSYAAYLLKLFWPVHLAMSYPMSPVLPLWEVALASAALLGLSILAWRGRAQAPYLLIGWLWYLGTLVPVIGLVQVGGQAMADRYTYFPLIGILAALVFGFVDRAGRWSISPAGSAGVGAVVLLGCMAVTERQIGYWRDSETLARHALSVTRNNAVAHFLLGTALDRAGRRDEAMREYREALRLKPDYAEAHNDLGLALVAQGKPGEALREYGLAIRFSPGYAGAHNNRGVALARLGRSEQAMEEYRTAIRLDPELADAYYNLGAALARAGRFDDAIAQDERAIGLRPDFADAHFNRALALQHQGRWMEAVAEFQQVAGMQPDSADVWNNLGVAFDALGRLDEAAACYKRAIRLKSDYVKAYFNLGVALGRQGRLDEAARDFEEALSLQPDYPEARRNLAAVLKMEQAAGAK